MTEVREFDFNVLDTFGDKINVYITDLQTHVYIEFNRIGTNTTEGDQIMRMDMALDATRVDSLIAALTQARQRITEAGE